MSVIGARRDVLLRLEHHAHATVAGEHGPEAAARRRHAMDVAVVHTELASGREVDEAGDGGRDRGGWRAAQGGERLLLRRGRRRCRRHAGEAGEQGRHEDAHEREPLVERTHDGALLSAGRRWPASFAVGSTPQSEIARTRQEILSRLQKRIWRKAGSLNAQIKI